MALKIAHNDAFVADLKEAGVRLAEPLGGLPQNSTTTAKKGGSIFRGCLPSPLLLL